MNDYILFKNIDGKYLTLKDCIEENKKPEETANAEEAADTKEEKKDASDEKKAPKQLSSM